MAKKETKAVVLTSENIVDQIEKKNFLSLTVGEQVTEDIEKEKEEAIKHQVKRRVYKATYQRDLALLQRRYSKKKNDIALYKIRQAGRLVRFLTGFTFDESVLEYAKTPDDLFEKEVLNEKDKTLTITMKDKKETFKLGDKVPAIIDSVDYDAMFTDLDKKIASMQRNEEEEHNKYVDKLKLAYGDYYDSRWRW